MILKLSFPSYLYFAKYYLHCNVTITKYLMVFIYIVAYVHCSVEIKPNLY